MKVLRRSHLLKENVPELKYWRHSVDSVLQPSSFHTCIFFLSASAFVANEHQFSEPGSLCQCQKQLCLSHILPGRLRGGSDTKDVSRTGRAGRFHRPEGRRDTVGQRASIISSEQTGIGEREQRGWKSWKIGTWRAEKTN